MNLMIKNDLTPFSPKRADIGLSMAMFVVGIMGGAITGILTIMSIFLGGFLILFPIFLFFAAMLGLDYLLVEGNAGKRLGSKMARDNYYGGNKLEQANKYLLYRRYKALPKELKAQIGEVTVEDLQEMTTDDAATVLEKIDTLEEAYRVNQRALHKPKVVNIIRNIDDARQSLNSSTAAVKELDNV